MSGRRCVMVVIALVAVLVGSAGVAPVSAAVPNSSLLFYQRTATPRGYRSKLAGGVYTSVGPRRFRGGYTSIAVSRSSVFLYNAGSGAAESGTFTNGVYRKKFTFRLDKGWGFVVASCDSLVLYSNASGTGIVGTLTKGQFLARVTVSFGPIQDMAASCDTLLLREGPTATTMTITQGVVQPQTTNYFVGSDVGSATATADSVLFYNDLSGTGRWGTLTGGKYTETGSSSSFSIFNVIAGTADSLLLYANGDSTAATATLTGGVYNFTGTVSGFSPNWFLIAGGK